MLFLSVDFLLGCARFAGELLLPKGIPKDESLGGVMGMYQPHPGEGAYPEPGEGV